MEVFRSTQENEIIKLYGEASNVSFQQPAPFLHDKNQVEIYTARCSEIIHSNNLVYYLPVSRPSTITPNYHLLEAVLEAAL